MKNPLKVAAWSGVSYLILGAISIILGIYVLFKALGSFFGGYTPSAFLSIFPLVISFISLICSILFIYGFVVLGRKYKNKLLKVLAWISLVLIILSLIVSIILLFVSPLETFLGVGSFGTVFTIIILALFFIFNILWGIALIKLRKQFKIAKSAGILRIIFILSIPVFYFLLMFLGNIFWGVGPWVLILFLIIILLLGLATYILEIILLFRASKRTDLKQVVPRRQIERPVKSDMISPIKINYQ